MQPILTASSSKVVILSGFSAILILLGLLIAVSDFSINDNSQSLNEIVQEHKEIDDIFAMREAAQKRSLLIYEMSSTDDVFRIEEISRKIRNEAAKFILAREHLLQHNDTNLQKELWKEVQPLIVAGANYQQQVIELLLDDQKELANELLKKVIPAQENVMAGLTKMLNTQRNIINQKLKATQNKNHQYHNAALILGSIAVLLGLSIAIFVYRHNDITELNLLQQKQVAIGANQAKSTFLANMSHEIRTPLTAIIGFTEQILNSNLSLTEQKRLKQTIVRNSKHLQDLINEILDLSKIESGQLELEMTATSPVHINYEIESIISKRALDKNISFIVNNQFPLPSSIITDSVRLKQILINLCSNAIKFTSEGKVQLDTHFNTENNSISFSVTDTGIGLSDEEQEKIFNPFIQGDVTTTRKFGGTGLGLSISLLLARELGGTLECISEKGKGSHFIFTLPIGITGKIKMITNQETYEPIPDNSFDNIDVKQLEGNILLAEDVIDNQELISMYVRQTGAQLEVVDNGYDAINKALDKEYDLILMDMQMPRVDGIEAITTLRNCGYTRPIISLTANVLSSDQDKCMNAGADYFLAKPININAFYKMLNSYLKEKTSQPAKEKEQNSTVTSGIARLTENFIAQLPVKISLVNEAIISEDWEQLDHTTHFLKGVGGSFGFPEITDSAGIVNDAVRENDFDNISELVNNLVDTCNNTVSSYKKKSNS